MKLQWQVNFAKKGRIPGSDTGWPFALLVELYLLSHHRCERAALTAGFRIYPSATEDLHVVAGYNEALFSFAIPREITVRHPDRNRMCNNQR
jgi:hypothetical protein